MNAAWIKARDRQAANAASFEDAARRGAAEIANAGLTPDDAGRTDDSRAAELAHVAQWKVGPMLDNAAAARVARGIVETMDSLAAFIARGESGDTTENETDECAKATATPFAYLLEYLTRSALAAVPTNATSRSTSVVANVMELARAAAFVKALDVLRWDRGDEP